jgi:hypothetical protein
VIEALGVTKRWVWWTAHKTEVDNGARVRVFRTYMTPAQRKRVLEHALQFVGRRYGWWKLLFHLADRLVFRGTKIFSMVLWNDKRPICSYLVADVLSHVGISFGMHAHVADPDEMMDWCLKHPDIWREVK